MIVVADENIACGREAFTQFGEVRLVPGRKLTREVLTDADAIVVRSITRVNEALLDGTPVRFVGTATIGTDHIDFDYLNGKGITFADAAGAGARSVAEYVVAALLTLRERGIVRIEDERIGVVGAGAIGSRIAEFASVLGMTVVEYDPPRAEREAEFVSAPMEAVLDCDVIALSVPLTHEGEHATHHLLNDAFLARLTRTPVLINTARGGVVDSSALAHALQRRLVRDAVLDVWEGEPEVPVGLLNHCTIATPHIAGYSQDGKLKGTEMMAEALAAHLGRSNEWSVRNALPIEAGRLDLTALHRFDAARLLVRAAYDIERDGALLRETFGGSDEERRIGFDGLRKNYPVRREFPAWSFFTDREDTERMLTGLGFRAVGSQ